MGLTKALFNDLSEGVKGSKNLITDVPGVQVGHVTVDDDKVHSGVTAVIPANGNLFRNKLPAGVCVLNGFGKSVGLVQIEELGTLETPIVLTNTFSVGTAVNALTKKMLAENPEIGDTTSTVNPVVAECNDGDVSDIRAMKISEDDVNQAFANVSQDFEEGAVGAGRGMMCYDLKGGIGSSSRVVSVDDEHQYTVGTLTMTNYGYLQDFIVNGLPIGKPLSEMIKADKNKEEKGSIITVIATDAPLDARQLKRLAKRATVGINRSGGYIGNGSGEIVFAFSTQNRVAHFADSDFDTITRFNDNHIDKFFRAVAASVDESILSSMVHADSVIDRKNRHRLGLIDACLKLQNQDTKYSGLVEETLNFLGVKQ
ncbi:P1 family peptidase [Lentilactobacillus sp. SPB1-3]|uniref:P1 family peptidase n=1 Tax=Lentilactobacillus terminaliae TaxID=3003483 RepID=A0ACD5DGN2_9LACO|nr:P1 family peptidase [Lentilactobacillus sp. SPB1-3]MCZ0977027.1 P1 family peptidase [Lentilactobacillus sp. SPB1-3]